MMVPQRLIAGSQLTASAATYYTVGSNQRAIIHNLALTNTTASAVTATVHLISTGATETLTNMLISARAIAPGETYGCPEAVGFVLLATGTIRALASEAAKITITASGVEWTS